VSAVRQELAAAAGAHVRPEAIKNEALKLHTFAQVLAHKRAETRLKVEDAITALANLSWVLVPAAALSSFGSRRPVAPAGADR
jgi:hypothetical protein